MEGYRAKPTTQNAKAVADLLPTRGQARDVPVELVEKFYRHCLGFSHESWR